MGVSKIQDLSTHHIQIDRLAVRSCGTLCSTAELPWLVDLKISPPHGEDQVAIALKPQIKNLLDNPSDAMGPPGE